VGLKSPLPKASPAKICLIYEQNIIAVQAMSRKENNARTQSNGRLDRLPDRFWDSSTAAYGKISLDDREKKEKIVLLIGGTL